MRTSVASLAEMEEVMEPNNVKQEVVDDIDEVPKAGSFILSWISSLSSSWNLNGRQVKPLASDGETRREKQARRTSRRSSSRRRSRTQSPSSVRRRSSRRTSSRRTSVDRASDELSTRSRQSFTVSGKSSTQRHSTHRGSDLPSRVRKGSSMSHGEASSSLRRRSSFSAPTRLSAAESIGSSRRSSSSSYAPRRSSHSGMIRALDSDDHLENRKLGGKRHTLSAIPSEISELAAETSEQEHVENLSESVQEFVAKLSNSMDEQFKKVSSGLSWSSAPSENVSRRSSRSHASSGKENNRSEITQVLGESHRESFRRKLSEFERKSSGQSKSSMISTGAKSASSKMNSSAASLPKASSWQPGSANEQEESSVTFTKARSTNQMSSKLGSYSDLGNISRRPSSQVNENGNGRIFAMSLVDPIEQLPRISYVQPPEMIESRELETAKEVEETVKEEAEPTNDEIKVKKKVKKKTVAKKAKKRIARKKKKVKKVTNPSAAGPAIRRKSKVARKKKPKKPESLVEPPPRSVKRSVKVQASTRVPAVVAERKPSQNAEPLVDVQEEKVNGNAPASWLSALKPARRTSTAKPRPLDSRRASQLERTASVFGAHILRKAGRTKGRGSGRHLAEDVAVYADDEIMDPKGHGSCSKAVQDDLRFGVKRRQADKLCCFTRSFAEATGYWRTHATLMEAISASHENEFAFYDSVHGKRVFVIPRGRPIAAFLEESTHHGWPSFRDPEVDWQNVRLLKSGETVTVDGVHLGHNLPDGAGRRFCINLSCIAGSPTGAAGGEKGLRGPIEPAIVACRDEDFQRAHGELPE